MNHLSNWFFIPKPNPLAKLHLIFFPYAGGNAAIFMPWLNLISPDIEVVMLQYPGRANRFNEPLITDFDEMVNKICIEIAKKYKHSELAFFGHSMGGRLAYEVAAKLQKFGINLKFFMPSGIKAPHIEADKNTVFYQRESMRGGVPIYELNDKDFVEELRFLQGTPEVILNNKELLDIVLPILRADFKLARSYDEKRSPEKLNTEICCFYSDNDNTVNPESVIKWADLSNHKFQHNLFHGDHFFINHKYTSIINIINRKVSSVMCSNTENMERYKSG